MTRLKQCKHLLATAILMMLFLTSRAHADLFVGNQGINGGIAAFDSDLGPVISCPTPASARGLVTGNDGFLYVVNNSGTSSSIVRVSLATGACEEFIDADTLSSVNPQDIILDANGCFLVSNFTESCVHRFGPDGSFVETLVEQGGGGLSGAEGMCFGPLGSLFVSSGSSNAIIEYNPVTGITLHQLVPDNPSDLAEPVGIALGPDGNLYVASRNTASIIRFSPDTGQYLGVFVTPGRGGLTDLRGISFGDDGLLYVCSTTTSTIFRYCAQTGDFVDTFASGGSLVQPYYLTFLPNSTISQPTLLIRLSTSTLSQMAEDPLVVNGTLLNGPQEQDVLIFITLRTPDGFLLSLLPSGFQGVQTIPANESIQREATFGTAGIGRLGDLGIYAFVTRIVDFAGGRLLSYSLNRFEVVP